MEVLWIMGAITCLQIVAVHGHPYSKIGENDSSKAATATAGDQSFYPSFPPYDTTSQGYYQQEGAYSQRESAPYQQLNYEAYNRGPNEEETSYNLLGSGNFGVISGGTFYNDNDGESSSYNNHLRSFYSNGHGRPSYYESVGNYRQQEQFADFKDFADINTPSYSEYVVVYANKDSKNDHSGSYKGPKNIIEQLDLLDNKSTAVEKTKNSKNKKKKVAEKKQRVKTTTMGKDLGLEPLLALS